ncbi:MAG: FHA domain-containing protein [Dehalococcoidia bacterium]
MPLLIRVPDVSGGGEYPLVGTVSIGRGDQNTVSIEHFDVARRHAEVVLVEGDAFFYDLGAPNGSKVNGAPATPDIAVPLKAGDQITIADVLTFEVAEEASIARAPAVAPPVEAIAPVPAPVESPTRVIPPVAAPPVHPRPAPPLPRVEETAATAAGGDPPVAPRPRRGLLLLLAAGVTVLVVGGAAAFALVGGGDDDAPASPTPASATTTAPATASAASTVASPTPTAAVSPTATLAPSATPTATVAGPTPLPSVTPPAEAGGRSQLRSGLTAVVGTAGCTLKASTEPTEAQSPTNRVVLQLCLGDEVVVATNSPAISTVRVTEGLVFWRVLVKKTGDVLWVKEVEVVSGNRFLVPLNR